MSHVPHGNIRFHQEVEILLVVIENFHSNIERDSFVDGVFIVLGQEFLEVGGDQICESMQILERKKRRPAYCGPRNVKLCFGGEYLLAEAMR